MQQQTRKERFFFDVPWTNLDESSRANALEHATDIVFSDRSAVRWNGLNFEAHFGYSSQAAVETEADRFLEERYEAMKKAAGL